MSNYLNMETVIGRICIAETDNTITHLLLPGESAPAGSTEAQTVLLLKAADELREYFAGKRKSFDLPLSPQGTAFQQSVWNSLLQIPYGETRSYKQIAELIGCPAGCRAVGGANNRNPISIIIPCHRVIGANGSMVGYGGGLKLKEYLLALEAVHLR
jgi:methylated-DNA-[protein]-cysteine S-methyltransferase